MELLKTLGETGVEAVEAVFDIMATAALYVTIALLAAIVVYLIVASKRGEQAFIGARKVSAGIVIGYSVATIALLGGIKLLGKQLDGKLGLNFWLIVILAAAVLLWICVTAVLSKHRVAVGKWISVALGALIVAYVIVLLFVMPPKSDSYKPLDKTLMYVLSAILTAVIVALSVLFGHSSSYDSRSLTYAAICIASSFALSYVKFFTVGAQGGSVTLASLLPLALYSYMFGLRKGVVAGVVYGLLQFVQSPQAYEPMQLLLDYPIAFGAIGLAGIGKGLSICKGKMFAEFAFGTTVAVIFRYIAHLLSGYFVFSSWAWEGFGALAYSAVYNLFVFVDLAVVLVAAAAILSSSQVRRAVANIANERQA